MATPLLDWIEHLMRDTDARDAFLEHPDQYAKEHGFDNLSSADVHDALNLIADNGADLGNGFHYPAPKHWQSNGDQDGSHYLRGYFDDNRNAFDRSDTDLDNSVHQDIETRDGREHHWHDDWNDWHDHGDFNQTLDNDPVVASGDESVATGGDLTDSTVTSGYRNIAGHNNEAVTGEDNSTAFGSGDAAGSHIGRFHGGDGSALSVGADSYGHSSDDDTSTRVHNSGDGDTSVNAAGDHGYADNYADQTHHDNSSRSDYEDHSSVDSHEDYESHNSERFSDSHDYDVHH